MRRPTILIVEDEPPIRDILLRSLRGENYEVLVAEDGERGLELVPEADLALVNLHLPKISGEEFIRTLRVNGNYLPIIIVTAAMGREQGLRYFEKYKIVDFVEKPFRREEILGRVREGLKVSDDIHSVEEANESLASFIQKWGA